MSEAAMGTSVETKPGKIIGPTKDQADAAHAGKLEQKGLGNLVSKLAKNWAVRLGLTTAVVGTGIGVYEAVKPSGEQLIVVPDTFDPTALKGVIGANNMVEMTVAEYEKSGPPLWDEETRTMSMPLAITFKDGITRPLQIEKTPNAIDGKLMNVITINGLQTGDTLKSPIDGIIEFSQRNLGAFFLTKEDSRGTGYNISLVYSTTGLAPLIDLNNPLKKSSEGRISIPIKRGDPIGTLLTSQRHTYFNGQIQITGFGPLLEKCNIATAPDSKAIMLQ